MGVDEVATEQIEPLAQLSPLADDPAGQSAQAVAALLFGLLLPLFVE